MAKKKTRKTESFGKWEIGSRGLCEIFSDGKDGWGITPSGERFPMPSGALAAIKAASKTTKPSRAKATKPKARRKK